MAKYSKILNPANVPQSQPLDERQVKNDAGGYVYAIDKWAQLKRFLILGSEGGSYYVNAGELTARNVQCVRDCLAEDGVRTVNMIVDVSKRGLAPKNSPAILALVLCTVYGSDATRSYAYTHLSDVCRTATHLFEFLELRQSAAFKDGHNGFGRGLRTAVGKWYTNKAASQVAYQVIKYRNRNDWKHKDVLILAHPKTDYADMNALFNWVVNDVRPPMEHRVDLVEGFLTAQSTTNVQEWVSLIREYNLPREALPTQALNKPEVWAALLEKMPITAMIRNLGNMGKHGVIAPLTEGERQVVNALTKERLINGRVHPIAILLALKTYQSGKGLRGGNEWPVNQTIVQALNEAFYDAFHAVKPTGKRFLVGLDVSGSMSSYFGDMPLKSCEVSGAFSMMFKRVEKTAHTMAFSDEFKPIDINPTMSLEVVSQRVLDRNFGNTDCALPMIYALQNNIPVDVFMVITDNQTWSGSTHPKVALDEYRRKTGIPAKLIVLATESSGFSIADPNDAGMLDIAGFSADVFSLVENFARDEF